MSSEDRHCNTKNQFALAARFVDEGPVDQNAHRAVTRSALLCPISGGVSPIRISLWIRWYGIYPAVPPLSLGARIKTAMRRDFPPAKPPPPYRDAVLAAYTVAAVALPVIAWLITNQVDAGVATFMLMLAVIRTYSLYRSVAWIWKRGSTFRQKWEALPADQRQAVIEETTAGQNRLFQLYRDTGGLFIPFGIRALVAYRWHHNSTGWSKPIRRQLYRLWKFYFFTFAWSVALCVFAYSDRRIGTFAHISLTCAAVLVILGCISIGIEAALSYLILGGWSLSYHQLNVQVSHKVTELAAFGGGALSLIFSVQSAVAFEARQSAFTAVRADSGISSQIGESFYYAITMLTGNGDPGPVGYAGHLVSGLAFAASILFLVIVISLLFDVISSR